MIEWWDTFSNFEKVFWYIAIPFSILLILQMILTFAGMGGADADIGDTDTDVANLSDDMDSDSADNSIGEPAFHLFTVRSFIAFFTLFGWGGIAAFENGLNRALTITVAFIAGLIALSAVSFLFYFISKLADNGGSLKINNALNKVGTVYIPIMANSGNIGKLQIEVQGSLRELQAVTKCDANLKTGDVVVVTSILNDSVLVVERLNKQ